MTGKNAFPGEGLPCVLPGGGISRGPGGGPGRRPPVSPVMPGPAWRPGGDVDAGSPPSGPVLAIAAEAWGLFRLRRRAVHTPRSSRFSSISASRV